MAWGLRRTKDEHMENNANSPALSADRYQVHPPHRARPAWREEIVRIERGFVRGIRFDSSFFVHFFGISVVIAAAIILGVGWMQWVAMIGCLTVVLTAQMFNQALKTLANADEKTAPPHVDSALAIGVAAVLVACTGSTLILAVIFCQRIRELFVE
jgi:diacylglycerol kinase